MSDSAPTVPPPSVLVVDDTPANLRLLVGMLKEHGYKVRPVPSGDLALKAVEASPPDLILLDITMPELDGFAVLARLKADPATRDIPVIFVSALGETDDKVRGFRAGGVDYITKPFQFEEVEARVRVHLTLRNQQRELRRQFEQLCELERKRDELAHMIVHDMRSPLTGVQLCLELLATKDGRADAQAGATVHMGRRAVALLMGMVNQVLDVSRVESGRLELRPTTFDLAELVREVVAGGRTLAGRRELATELPASLPLTADRDVIRRVLENLVGNALKFTTETGRVAVRARAAGERVSFEVSDDGPGIPPEQQSRIFEKFGQLDSRQRGLGSGLGLTFAKMAAEAHGGTIEVRSAAGQGSTFVVTLPSAPGARA